METLLQLIVKGVNMIPFFKGHRTVLCAGAIGLAAALDAAGVTHGLYHAVSPYLYPVSVATALAHPTSR